MCVGPIVDHLQISLRPFSALAAVVEFAEFLDYFGQVFFAELGFGAQWLTGWAAYDATIGGILGLRADEKIAGFIHIGTPRTEAPERDRPDPRELLAEWTPD